MNQQILSQDEVDALLQGITGESQAVQAEEPPPPEDGARSYDIAARERLVGARMPAMEIVNERFARNIRGGLLDLIRRHAEVSIGGTRVQKYGSFLREIAVPSNFNVVAVEPLRGSGLVVCEPSIVFAAIDALFGGVGRFHARIEGREFSPTEMRVIRRLVDTVTAEYRKAWNGIYPLELKYRRSEMQPQFANIAAPSDMVVSTSFTLEIGEAAGSLVICIPYATLEPIRETLFATIHSDATAPDPRWLGLLQSQIQGAEVELVAELATAPATVEQLLAFKPGDFVELDLDQLIEAKVDGVPVFKAHYGTSNGRYAIKIDELLTGAQAGWLGDSHHVR